MDINKLKEFFWRHKILSGILVIIILIVLFFFYLVFISSGLLSSSVSRSNYGYAPSMAEQDGYYEKTSNGLSAPSSAYEDYSDTSTSQNTNDQRKIIQTASLDLYVDDTDTSVAEIKNISIKYGGYVESSNIREMSSGVKGGSVTLKVPATSFQNAIDDIKVTAEKVKGESINSSDVTDRYVDLSANLKNYQAEEQQYIEIMKSAFTVEDILMVQQKLSDVRGRIERAQAQLIQLDRQTDMSTITVSITSEPDVEILGITWKPLNTIRLEFRDFLLDMKNIFESLIAFLFALPGLIIRIGFFVLVVVLAIKAIRFVYRKFLKTKSPEIS